IPKARAPHVLGRPWSLYTASELESIDGEGRCVVTDHGAFVLFNVYGPAISSEEKAAERMEYKMMFYQALELRLREYISAERRVLLVGDLNIQPRPEDCCDCSGRDADRFYESRWDRRWLQSLTASGDPSGDVHSGSFRDTFRIFHPSRRDAFTCWSTASGARVNNYGTRIDLLLAADGADFSASNMRSWVVDGDIMPEVQGSDHCPAWVTLRLAMTGPPYDEDVTMPSSPTFRQGFPSSTAAEDPTASSSFGCREPPRLSSRFMFNASSLAKQATMDSFFSKRTPSRAGLSNTAIPRGDDCPPAGPRCKASQRSSPSNHYRKLGTPPSEDPWSLHADFPCGGVCDKTMDPKLTPMTTNARSRVSSLDSATHNATTTVPITADQEAQQSTIVAEVTEDGGHWQDSRVSTDCTSYETSLLPQQNFKRSLAGGVAPSALLPGRPSQKRKAGSSSLMTGAGSKQQLTLHRFLPRKSLSSPFDRPSQQPHQGSAGAEVVSYSLRTVKEALPLLYEKYIDPGHQLGLRPSSHTFHDTNIIEYKGMGIYSRQQQQQFLSREETLVIRAAHDHDTQCHEATRDDHLVNGQQGTPVVEATDVLNANTSTTRALISGTSSSYCSSTSRAIVSGASSSSCLSLERSNLNGTHHDHNRQDYMARPLSSSAVFGRVGGGGGVPNCQHGEAAVIRYVKKKGGNSGRAFYCCARPEGLPPQGRCEFFQWVVKRVGETTGSWHRR
ncbi:hypothetical protein CEUSTIGMA_g10424.t1, partial [Chlamydomonas eustigma]